MRKGTGAGVKETNGSSNKHSDTANYKVTTAGDYIQNNGSSGVVVP